MSSVQYEKKIACPVYDELGNERRHEVADEAVASEGLVAYGSGASPVPAGSGDMKRTGEMVTAAASPDNRHHVEEMVAEDDRVVVRVGHRPGRRGQSYRPEWGTASCARDVTPRRVLFVGLFGLSLVGGEALGA